MEKKYNVKVILLLSALCCVLMILGQLYIQKKGDPGMALKGKEVDVVLFMGQSNMGGACGNAEEAPDLIPGAGYEYRAVTDPGRLWVLQEPFGRDENREGGLDDRGIMVREGSLVTAYVNACYEKTQVPIVGISASRGSSSMNGWLNKGLKEDAQERLFQAVSYLESKKIKIRHTYMLWFQGESDGNLKQTREEYKADMNKLVASMKEAGVEKCFLIQLSDDPANPGVYAEIMAAQLELCEENEDVVLASDLPARLTDASLRHRGGVHFMQEGLNLIGTDAGKNVGTYLAEQEN